MTNRLYFGDNLDILRRQDYVSDRSVDLIYLDPPFNSQAQYNLLFERRGTGAATAQAGAFRDTWRWEEEASLAHNEIMRMGGAPARLIEAYLATFDRCSLTAYLVMMTVRLQLLRQKLKDTGSLYLHCDPTSSHYLKAILDTVFKPENFLSEVIWRRTGTHSSARRWGPVHDVILFYAREAGRHTWNRPYLEHSAQHLRRHYRLVDTAGRAYEHGELTGPGVRHGRSGLSWRGFDVTAIGRHWTTTIDRLEQLAEAEQIHFPEDGGWPRLIRYREDSKGRAIGDVWEDIPPLNMRAHERIGYPTQKPLALMKRIIEASSRPGDLVLDPFCGCGTTIEAAETMGRQWIGIDVAVHAIKVIERRLGDAQSEGRISSAQDYKVEGMPRDFASAEKLATDDPYQFQWWANYLFNPHALREQKRGADRGIDGELFFPNGPGRPWGRLLISVKGGKRVGSAMVRDFRGVLGRERAEMGLFVCLYEPTQEMRTEAAAAGIADTVHGDLPRIQLVSIAEWFEGRVPRLPPLEHLPTAALTRTTRRASDPDQPQFLLPFREEADAVPAKRHFNPQMVQAAKPKARSA